MEKEKFFGFLVAARDTADKLHGVDAEEIVRATTGTAFVTHNSVGTITEEYLD
jgi:hypothetical protein